MSTSYGLYFHIPFCTKKCPYCHFYVIPEHEDSKDALLAGLKAEIGHWQPVSRSMSPVSVYFGGGTPSLFGPERIAALLQQVGGAPTEVTLEANPGDITPELMAAYRDAGINRVSIGVQSFDDNLLQHLGREHSAADAAEAVTIVRDAGIDNITIDLMYDVPHQTMDLWQQTLDTACSLPISHLSLYNLTIEPHTAFHKKRNALAQVLPDPDASAAMYKTAIRTLEAGGLQQYEISAFAKPGKRAIHNTGYWTGRPFLGFGPSAYSYWDGWRFRNTPNLRKYCRAVEAGTSAVDEQEKLLGEAHIRELLIVGIRLREGIELTAIGATSDTILRDLRSLEKQELITINGQHATLTQRGILFYDTVAETLV